MKNIEGSSYLFLWQIKNESVSLINIFLNKSTSLFPYIFSPIHLIPSLTVPTYQPASHHMSSCSQGGWRLTCFLQDMWSQPMHLFKHSHTFSLRSNTQCVSTWLTKPLIVLLLFWFWSLHAPCFFVCVCFGLALAVWFAHHTNLWPIWIRLSVLL